MRVYAFVPARSGSKGLPDKNILEIDGHPLMTYAIAFGRKLGVDRVIVSTDSPAYAAIARDYGADCPYLRGPKASSDTAMEEEILADMTANLPAHGIEPPDIWIRLKPTNPFRRVEAVHAALDILRDEPETTSVRIVSEEDARQCVIDDDGLLRTHGPYWDPNRSIMRRTEFPRVFSPFNLDVFRHSGWETRFSGFMGDRIRPIIEHKITGMDINDADDFEIVRTMIEMRPEPALVARHLVRPGK